MKEFLTEAGAIAFGIGLLLGFFTMKQRDSWGAKDGDAPQFSFFWMLEMGFCWPLFLIAKTVAFLMRSRAAVHRKIDKRPPKWYDWLFF